MIVPQQIFFWGRRFFFYGAVVAIGIFLIVLAAGSYHPRIKPLANTESQRRDTPSPTTALNIDALPSLVGNVAMLPAVKSPEVAKKSPNLTEQFAASLAKDIVSKNPNGPGAEGAARKLATPDISASLERFLKNTPLPQGASSRPIALPINVVADADIATSIEYFKKFNAIFNSWTNNVASADASDDVARFFSSVATGQRDAANQLQSLAVPASFVDAHQRALDFLFTNSVLAAQLSREADSDPLQATLLLGKFAQMRTIGLVIVKDLFADFTKAFPSPLRS